MEFEKEENVQNTVYLEDTRKQRLVMLLSLSFVFVLLFIVYFFVRPAFIKPKAINTSGVEYFYFERNYKNGDCLELSMNEKKGFADVIVYDSTLGGKREKTLPASALNDLNTMIILNEIYKLDQYYERVPSLGHENSFELEINYADGQDVFASGETILPSNLEEISRILKGYFFSLFSHE